MQVLFLALGASRKRAVAEETAAVVGAGGRAVVLVARKKSWEGQSFAPGVQLVTSEELVARHLPRRLERLVLYRVPRAVVRVVGRGPLGSGARRALKAYERRVAGRIHRRLFVPLHRRLWPRIGDRMVRSHFPDGRGPEMLVVADALSVQRALGLIRSWEASGLATPRVSYSVDTLVPPQSSAAR
ncbi:hypothetical protein V1460_29550 [Streptomyces sp. SCSIO 30461]|uniref:hypothetical protein n=1 Tax=Streptomyces sp. SCSIO 30461 TaxID=3118085 RepID=UPI0030CDDDB8